MCADPQGLNEETLWRNTFKNFDKDGSGAPVARPQCAGVLAAAVLGALGRWQQRRLAALSACIAGACTVPAVGRVVLALA